MSSSKTVKKIDPPNPDSNAWMITFGDLIMLLLTFFVLLLTMKSMNQKDLKELFPNISDRGGPLEFSENGFTGNSPDFFGDNENAVFVETSDALKQLFTVMKDIQTSLPDKNAVKHLQEAIQIEDDPKGVLVSLQTDQLFEPGKATIHPSKIYLLDAAGELLKMTSNDILIMGHASNLKPPKRFFKTNWDLTLYRALHVLYYLTANFEMKETRMAIGGGGDKMPKVSGLDIENQKKNDRIEFILMKAKT